MEQELAVRLGKMADAQLKANVHAWLSYWRDNFLSREAAEALETILGVPQTTMRDK